MEWEEEELWGEERHWGEQMALKERERESPLGTERVVAWGRVKGDCACV